LSPDPLPVYIH